METTRPLSRNSRDGQKGVRTLKQLSQIKNLLIILLAVVLVLVVFKVITRQFERPKTYYEFQLQTWNQILAKNPKDPTARARIAEVYLRMNQDARAVAQLKSIIKDDPKYMPAHYYLAIAYQKQGLKREAEESLLKTLSLIKNDKVKALPAYRLALMYEQQGKTEPAIKYFTITTSGEPLMWNPHFKLGGLYEKKGDLNKALTHYEGAVRFNPSKKLKSKIDEIKAKLGR